MPLTYRPIEVSKENAKLVADLHTRAEPDEPDDWMVILHGWNNSTPGYTRERFFIDVDGVPSGAARHAHPIQVRRDSFSSIQVYLVPEALSVGRLAEAYTFIEGRTTAAGLKVMETYVYQDDAVQSAALGSRNWQPDRTAKVWELDLVEERERLLEIAADSRLKMGEQGIRCLPLAADADPGRYRKLHELAERAARDIPTTMPMREGKLSEFMAFLAGPQIDEGRYWIARDGDHIIGLSHLKYPPVQGNIWTGFTASSPDYRGRGVARAVKMETLVQAIELAIPRVRTDNDSENAPMIHINETLGYSALPALQSYLKRV